MKSLVKPQGLAVNGKRKTGGADERDETANRVAVKVAAEAPDQDHRQG